MNLFIGFGQNIGNLGRGPKPLQCDLVENWNRALSKCTELKPRFIEFFYSTGNYILSSSQPVPANLLSDTLATHINSHRFAIFDYPEFVTIFESLQSMFRKTPARGRTWTPGIVMDTNATGQVPPEPTSNRRMQFGSFALPRIRVVWKKEVLSADGNRLDSSHKERQGGWGQIANRMEAFAGGTWTARSMNSVDGIMNVAVRHMLTQDRP